MPSLTLHQIFQLALQHHQQNHLAEAEQLYRRVLSVEPRHADTLHLLGVLLGQKGNLPAALDSIRQAIALRPEALYYANLGKFLADSGRHAEAITAFQQAIRLKPSLAEPYNNLGNSLKATGGGGRFDEAMAAYRTALQLKPNYPEVLNNLANAHRERGELDAAIDLFHQCLALRPNYAEAHSNLANALTFKGKNAPAIAAAREAIRLKPDFAEAFGNLGNALRDTRDYDGTLAAYRRALELKPNRPEIHSNLLLAMNYHPKLTRADFLAEARRWKTAHAAPLAPPRASIQPHTNDKNPDRPLKIGYISADFRQHASAYFLEPLLRHHDRNHFEIFCYAHLAREDDHTATMKSYAHHWRNIFGLDDPAAADLIRNDKIDILVDLKLHTGAHRLLLFARQPAPLQVTWLGYPGTTGLDTIHFHFTDPHLDPPGTESYYSEKPLHLDTFWCYDPLASEPPVNALPALSNNHITFGCLNNFCKINDDVLLLWSRILQQLPTSRLLLLAVEEDFTRPVLSLLQQQGIAPSRIEFLPRRDRPDYLRFYHRIDIALDTFPYNGHTTSLDAFWMGVPVLTLPGQTAPSRAGLSQLMNLNLPDLIATSPEDYVSRVTALANDLPRLQTLRQSLRPLIQKSPLMDAPRFVRSIEHHYRAIWRIWCTT